MHRLGDIKEIIIYSHKLKLNLSRMNQIQMFWWFFIVLLLVHGLIHLMGALSELGITDIEDLSGKTLVNLSETAKKALGVVWLIVMFLFFVATYGFITEQNWWQALTYFSIILSQILVVIWWSDAKFGTFANILIFVGMVFEY